MQCMSDMVKTRRLRSAADVLRQSEDRPADIAMNWVVEDGKRTRGRLGNAVRTAGHGFIV